MKRQFLVIVCLATFLFGCETTSPTTWTASYEAWVWNSSRISDAAVNDAETTWASNSLGLVDDASGTRIYAVWERAAGKEIQFRRSEDGGSTWETPVTVVDGNSRAIVPKVVAMPGNDVFLVWRDFRNNTTEVFFTKSTDDGDTWPSPGNHKNLTEDATKICIPNMDVIDNGSSYDIHVVYEDYEDGSNQCRVKYQYSSDGGSTWWEDPITLAEDTGGENEGAPFIHVANDGELYLTYASHEWYNMGSVNGWNWEIQSNETISGSWQTEVRNTTNKHDSRMPASALDGDYLHLVWFDDRHDTKYTPHYGNALLYPALDHNYEIYYLRGDKSCGSMSWGPESRLTSEDYISSMPKIATGPSGSVYIVYENGYKYPPSGIETLQIFFMYSGNYGSGWSSPTRLTGCDYDAYSPSVMVDDDNTAHIIYTQIKNASGDTEVRYINLYESKDKPRKLSVLKTLQSPQMTPKVTSSRA